VARIFSIFLFAFLIIGFGLAYGQTTHIVKIPTGASDPAAPYFWSVQKTGNTNGIVEAYLDDFVVWKNADVTEHTVVAQTLDNTATLFESGLIEPGDEFAFQFTEVGLYEYYCSLYPWMSGSVNVILNPGHVHTLKNVASGLDEYGVGFEVKYILDTNLSNTVDVNQKENSLTFTISEQTKNDKITMSIPRDLLEDPNTVWVDENQVDFESEETVDGTKLIIPLGASPSEVKIMGTKVIPEFAGLVYVTLIISILGILLFSKAKFLTPILTKAS